MKSLNSHKLQAKTPPGQLFLGRVGVVKYYSFLTNTHKTQRDVFRARTYHYTPSLGPCPCCPFSKPSAHGQSPPLWLLQTTIAVTKIFPNSSFPQISSQHPLFMFSAESSLLFKPLRRAQLSCWALGGGSGCFSLAFGAGRGGIGVTCRRRVSPQRRRHPGVL